MTRLVALLVFLASIGFVSAAQAADTDDANLVIAIDRSAGFTSAERARPIDHYRFTVVKDGGWVFKPVKGESRKGKLGAEDLKRWLEAIEDGGLYTVESNLMLGALDEPYMDITVRTGNRKTRVRIRLSETLSKAVEKKIVELAKPGE